MLLMKTVFLHCNGSWKYAVISREDSSGIWMFRWELGSTRMPNNQWANSVESQDDRLRETDY